MNQNTRQIHLERFSRIDMDHDIHGLGRQKPRSSDIIDSFGRTHSCLKCDEMRQSNLEDRRDSGVSMGCE